MTALFDTRKARTPTAATAVGGVVRKLGAFFLSVAKAHAARRQLAALAQLSDHQLRDIGLDRGDLRDASAVPFDADPTAILVVRAVERRAARQMALREAACARAGSSHREAA